MPFSADLEENLTDISDLKLSFFIRNILGTVKTYIFRAPYLLKYLTGKFFGYVETLNYSIVKESTIKHYHPTRWCPLIKSIRFIL